MKNRVSSLLLCILSSILLFTGCADSPKPEDTLKQLIRSFNSCDVDGVISCFDPTAQELYESILQLAGYFVFPDDWTSEEKMKSLVKVGGSLTYLTGNYVLEDGLPQLSITVNKKTIISEDRVLINATFTYYNKRNIIASSGETEDTTSMTADIEMARDGKRETWYILIFPDDDSPIEFYEAETSGLRLK